MARISVFGGTGYAGSNIAREATRRGHEVTSVSRNVPEERLDGVTYVQGSLLDPSARATALDGADVVVVAAAPRGEMAETLRDGVAALATEAAAARVRLGTIGGAGALQVTEGGPRLFDGEDFPAAYKPESLTMLAVLEDLQATDGLDWFYVRPPAMFGAFNPGQPRGTYRVGGEVLLSDENGVSDIGGADFGAAIVDEIETAAHPRTPFTVAY